MKRTVVVQKWEESERGWGTRPDGYSLHLSDADRKIYIKEYWDSMPDTAPDEYSRPDGTPYPCDVDEEIYEEVKKKQKRHSLFQKSAGFGRHRRMDPAPRRRTRKTITRKEKHAKKNS